MIILDLVQVHVVSTSPQTLSFATADMVVIIASINFASRAYSLSNAIPLLVSFDFITKFSSEIVKGVVIEDVDAIKKAEENDYWKSEKEYLRFLLPLILMTGIVITAIVLASLSITITVPFAPYLWLFFCMGFLGRRSSMVKKIYKTSIIE